MTDAFQLPPPPDPTTVEQWTGQIRTLIVLAGGIGLGSTWLGHLTDAQVSSYVTAAITVLSLAGAIGSAISSWISKRRKGEQERKLQVASAIASADATHKAGVPVAVTVSVVEATPVGQPDKGKATLISSAEASAAPVVPLGQRPSPAPLTP